MKTTLTLDSRIVGEVKAITGAGTESEAVLLALREYIRARRRPRQLELDRSAERGQNKSRPRTKPRWTPLQGQYLAFIHAYQTVHGVAPAEWEMQRHFRVSPPSVHRMVLALDERGLIRRTPGKARSIELLVPPQEIPLPLTQPPSRSQP